MVEESEQNKRRAMLFRQSFGDYKRDSLKNSGQAYSAVSLGLVVAGPENVAPAYDEALDTLKSKLEKKALDAGATHVFGVSYNLALSTSPRSFSFYAIAYGDAYKIDENKEKPLNATNNESTSTPLL